ncbi:MAG: carboxyl transferase domain-containing protein [Acidimicrobiales bacterium]|nr:carboxyl transferase domain-containing protein [Acidimicrobiales bacterium]MDG2216837.1 carboxyl transferase domain-containing protein [Acidimicrobiales bacterium]
MPRSLLAPPLPSSLDTHSEQFARNCADMLEQLHVHDELLDKAAEGGGEKPMARHRSRGKLPIRERIANVIDPDTPFLEITPLAGFGSQYALGGGMVVGIGIIAGTECVIMGNDPTVAAGALTPYASKKWMRALEIARDNRMPYVSFVESAGGDLRPGGGGAKKKGGEDDDHGAVGSAVVPAHFAETGRFFYEMTELSKLRIPTVCVVFGSSTAGGAYQPGMSDYNIFVKEQSFAFLAGPPLVKMATGEIADSETIGGAQKHAEVTGLAEYLAEDEMDALRLCREVVSHLNWRKPDPVPTLQSDEPIEDPEELLGLVSRDLRQPVDVRDVMARVVDGSRFEEFKPRYGTTMVCGWASIHGYPVGVLGNNGVIYPDSAQKAAHFIQLCNKLDVPLVFFQNITGFMVGTDFESDGIIKKGSQMINAVTNSLVPHLTVIIGSSYGAGTYGMSGRAFGNRFTFTWPTAKIAVMGPKQIAGVMSEVRRGQAARKGEEFDEVADAAIVAAQELAHDKGSVALRATGAISDDGIIDPRDTRTVLGLCLSVVRNRPIEGAHEYGVFRL